MFSLALSASLIYLVVQENEALYRQNVSNNIVALTKNTSEELVDAMASDTVVISTTSVLLKFDEHEYIVAAYVFDNQGQLVQPYLGPAGLKYMTNSVDFATQADQAPNGSSEIENLLYQRIDIGSADYLVGKLVVIADVNSSIFNARQSFLERAIPIAVAIAVLMGIVFTVLLRMQFSPVLKLNAFTERVTKKRDYSARFPIKGRNEISRLGKSINTMIETIVDELERNLQKTQQLSKQQDDMEKLANFDSLTGLPNRQYMMEHLRVELARAKREKRDLVVMFFDLDGFKGINDTLGHDTGDKVLTAVADRLRNQLRAGDTIARLGGDEFLLVPHNTANDEVFALVAHKIIHSMEKPFVENGLDLHIGVSIGIARASQAEYHLSDLISYADIAMYESKKAGKGQFTLFDPKMVDGHKRKLSIANGIPTALANDEFQMVYQPKVNTQKDIVGFEALLRWHSDELGWISPAEFIPIAEQGGKIAEITSWVIQSAFRDTPKLVERFGKHIRISLNLSAIDLMNPALTQIIESQRLAAKVNAANIEFEVTESAYLENFKDTNRFFNAFTKKGYHIALDDFGTGFSSLGYLTQISINTLKIDKQFVQNMEENPRNLLVTRTIIDLAKRLRLSICAEGIETSDHFDRLVREGCDTMQGYWFSKPIPLSQTLLLPTNLRTPETLNLNQV